MKKNILICIWIGTWQLAFPQDTLDFFSADSNRALYQQFIDLRGHEDEKILELIRLARADNNKGHILETIHKLQLGLALEKELEYPTNAVLELNVYVGDILSAIDPEYALEFYEKATKIGYQLSDAPPGTLFFLYSKRAGVHTKLGQEVESLHWYREAIRPALADNPISVASSYNNLGVYYLNQMMYDSARFYFQKAQHQLATHNMDIILDCAIRDNLAQLDIIGGHYPGAYATFLYNDSVYSHNQSFSSKYLANKVRLLDLMIRLKKSGVEDTLRRLEQYLHIYPLIPKPNDVLGLYDLAENYFYEHGNRRQELWYRDKYNIYTDSLSQTATDQLRALTKSLLSVQEVSFKNEMRLHQLEAEKTKLRLASTRRLAFIGLLAAVIIIILLQLYFQKRKQEMLAQQQIAESALKYKVMESRIMEQELELKKKDLTNLVLHNTQVHDANLKMIDRLEAVHGNEAQMQQQLRLLLHELEGQNQIGERSLFLQRNIESVNTGFYIKLLERFPNLTTAESELCGYLRIDLSTKDISILKHVEAGSIKMAKNRLRKKLGLEPDVDLYGFIKNL